MGQWLGKVGELLLSIEAIWCLDFCSLTGILLRIAEGSAEGQGYFGLGFFAHLGALLGNFDSEFALVW